MCNGAQTFPVIVTAVHVCVWWGGGVLEVDQHGLIPTPNTHVCKHMISTDARKLAETQAAGTHWKL